MVAIKPFFSSQFKPQSLPTATGLARAIMAPASILALGNDELAIKLGSLIIDAQEKALSRKSWFDIGISGGSQAPTLAASLLNNKKVKWDQWRVWLADERIVPLNHEDSNWRLFKEEILDKLPTQAQPKGITLSSELLAKGDAVSDKEFAAEYQQRLVAELGPEPVLDVALLGMGPDGHTCSLFPGHALLEEDKLLVSSLDDSPKPPLKRITLTKMALAQADQIVFLAAGAGKKDAIHRMFTENDTSLPSRQVIDAAQNQVIFLTDPAALGH